MKLSISEAARRAGVARPTLHKLIKDGKISKGIGDDGKPFIDLSELARKFPHVVNSTLQDDSHADTKVDSLRQGQKVNNDKDLQGDVATLRELLAAKDEQIVELKADKAKLWETVQAQNRLLTDQRDKPGVVRRAWNGLFGR